MIDCAADYWKDATLDLRFENAVRYSSESAMIIRLATSNMLHLIIVFVDVTNFEVSADTSIVQRYSSVPTDCGMETESSGHVSNKRIGLLLVTVRH